MVGLIWSIFARAALEYVCLIQEVQERKKFEFVETVSDVTMQEPCVSVYAFLFV